LSKLTLPSEETAEALALAMNDAAAAVEAFSFEIEQAVEPGGGWDLTGDGKVWVIPPGEPWFMSTESDIPEAVGLAMMAAQDELERSAVAVGLTDCMR
jgi:hypothetical protein